MFNVEVYSTQDEHILLITVDIYNGKNLVSTKQLSIETTFQKIPAHIFADKLAALAVEIQMEAPTL